MSFSISSKMAKKIKCDTGMSLEDIRKNNLEEIHNKLEMKIGHELKLGFEPIHLCRGSMLILEDRIIWPEEIDCL